MQYLSHRNRICALLLIISNVVQHVKLSGSLQCGRILVHYQCAIILMISNNEPMPLSILHNVNVYCN